MSIRVLNEYILNGKFNVVFKYWKTGDCACTATKVNKAFDFKPSEMDLLKSIKK